MSIKARLLVATAALLGSATVVIGVVAIGAVTTTMTDRVDSQLRKYPQQTPPDGPADAPPGVAATAERSDDRFQLYQSVAMLFVDSKGTVVRSHPAGFGDDPLPLPKLPSSLPDAGQIETATSQDGSTDYRITIAGRFEMYQGGKPEVFRIVAAAPLTEVVAVRNQLVTTMIITVAVVLTLALVAGWRITRRGLKPVDDMADTAEAIAAGNLRRRAKDTGKSSELGRLARSLNTMVSKLVNAISDREAEQARLRRFIADASHELRTPLATVGGYAELYESGGTPPGPPLDRAMHRIRAENQRMARLVDDLLLLARLDQRAVDSRERFDLCRMVIDCVDDSGAIAPDRTITVEAGDAVMVLGDESRLRQVATNLLANARQHTPEGTPIDVTVAAVDGTAIFSVTDHGPGIPSEHRDRVFDRLYRIDPSRSRATGGSGLGLSIVASIVASHHGIVQLESEPGEGTTVRVELPVAQPPRGD
ncbi:sensor histidine kinase [Stackebrandtia nassauensis]|uniref:histidine kinase n=1 Tax=Stackebrandtia nassauensis (strain DSM 44728 / CIP 108903 / NRRL B-16338 / NBRC 102104 / LLR-40K-21) TaxID=446470 RepID=D3Q0Q2_STANL|nr:HAMP domain-containing sensor histidine kinase [Stackebrandtia nassauensis]ADD41788.1 histidine kinase [Stackebrandtia nassauensis DSM 44728]